MEAKVVGGGGGCFFVGGRGGEVWGFVLQEEGGKKREGEWMDRNGEM